MYVVYANKESTMKFVFNFSYVNSGNYLSCYE